MTPTVFICARQGWGSGLSRRQKRPYVWTEGTSVFQARNFWNLKRQVRKWLQKNPEGRVAFFLLRERIYRPEDHDPHYLYKWRESAVGGSYFGEVDQFTLKDGNLVRTMAYRDHSG